MGNTELGEKKYRSSKILIVWRMIQTVFNLVNHTMIIFVALYMTYKCYTLGNQPITWHIFLCALGVSES